MTSRSQSISFRGSLGDDLAGELDLPARPVKAYALFAHCFTCGKDLSASRRIAAELTRHGLGVLRFDFTGLGRSKGDFGSTDFSSNLDDLSLAANWLAENKAGPQLLVGHSLGGAAVVAAAPQLPSVRAVVAVGAPAGPGHVQHLFADKQDEIDSAGKAEVSIGGRPFSISRDFIDDLKANEDSGGAGSLREEQALLLLHAPNDSIVPFSEATEQYGRAHHPKSIIAVDNADHLLSHPRDSSFVAEAIAHWADRYLVDENPAASVPDPTAPVVVSETGQGKFLSHVVVGNHTLLADEPESMGGFDAGPAPYDFLSAGLGACTSMTLRMYAERKGIPLERVTVEVTHGRVHADDSTESVSGQDANKTSGPKIDQFTRTLILEGDLTAQNQKDLLRIADRCPVHRSLETESRIVTKLDESTP